MTELVVATQNQGKMREIRDLLKEFDLKITSIADYPDAPEIIEDGETFADNAVKKAVALARHTGKLAMGEDSGLEVTALDNRPGVYSARFAGEEATDETNNAKLLELLKDVPASRRQARYRCCAALVQGDKTLTMVEGSCSGLITTEARGTNGFGYDPLFLIEEHDKTFGELDLSVKAQMSHRARAMDKVKAFLTSYLNR